MSPAVYFENYNYNLYIILHIIISIIELLLLFSITTDYQYYWTIIIFSITTDFI